MDQRVIHAHGHLTLIAVTAVTAQSADGAVSISPVSSAGIRAQIMSSFADFDIGCVKSGMITSASTVRDILSTFKSQDQSFDYVIDPVLQSSSGANLIDRGGRESLLSDLFPLATLITPNLLEAEVLTGMKIQSHDQKYRAAEALLTTGCSAVLIKGGHDRNNLGTDLLVVKEQPHTPIVIQGTPFPDRDVRGTGCAYASAIACGLAEGLPITNAVRQAKQYIHRAIEQAQFTTGSKWILTTRPNV